MCGALSSDTQPRVSAHTCQPERLQVWQAAGQVAESRPSGFSSSFCSEDQTPSMLFLPLTIRLKTQLCLLSPRKQRRRRERLGDPEAPRAQAALAAVSQAGKRCGCPASLPAPAATQASPAHRKGRRGACGLQVVSGSHVECPPRPHLCVPSVCRALQTTRGIGTSEPYLLFLKKALIAFCNCTVDKCPTSP